MAVLKMQQATAIKKVTVRQAEQIIDNKNPAGLYITKEHMMYTGIKCDGQGSVDVLACRDLPSCEKWLKGGIGL